MIADWTVDAGPESPVIVLPWDGWIDLRPPSTDDPARRAPSLAGSAQQVRETQRYPELLPMLRMANLGHTATSKVDIFQVQREEADPEIAEEYGLAATASGLGSYLDLVILPPATPPDFPDFEAMARRVSAALQTLEHPGCGAEIVIRPAHVFGEHTFALTLYALGFGEDQATARIRWAATALALVDTTLVHMPRSLL